MMLHRVHASFSSGHERAVDVHGNGDMPKSRLDLWPFCIFFDIGLNSRIRGLAREFVSNSLGRPDFASPEKFFNQWEM
jgi:hypothetical protein